MNGWRLHHLARYAALAVYLVVFSQTVHAAAKCHFNSQAGVNFGAYSVFDPGANINGVGRIEIDCRGAPNGPIEVTLSTGQSLSYASRVMKSGSNSLAYNLYTSSSRSVVWGDGSGGSHIRGAAKNSITTLYIFGKIPPGQDAAIGIYRDNITAIVKF